jgi:hypothetical protein
MSVSRQICKFLISFRLDFSCFNRKFNPDLDSHSDQVAGSEIFLLKAFKGFSFCMFSAAGSELSEEIHAVRRRTGKQLILTDAVQFPFSDKL